MRQVVLDTDVASLLIKQRLPAELLRQIVGAQVGITFITLGELTAGQFCAIGARDAPN